MATTVFTPVEYGCIGLSEEDANAKYGAQDIEIYHTHFTPLEWTVAHREENACYVKLVCVKSENVSRVLTFVTNSRIKVFIQEKVVGFHVLADHAGEITQGYSVAMRKGITKEDFDLTVGIHPTSSEASYCNNLVLP